MRTGGDSVYSQLRLIYLLILLVLPATGIAQTTFRWTGPTSGSWNLATNWLNNSNGLPVSSFPNSNTVNAIFNGTSTNTSVTLGQNISLSSLQFTTANTSAYTIGAGNTINFASRGSISVASAVTNSQTVNAAITAGGALSITNNSTATGRLLSLGGGINIGANTLTIGGPGRIALNGALSSTSTGTLSKTGTGEVLLNGSNSASFNGRVTVNGGTLAVDASNQNQDRLRSGTVVTVNNGARFEVRGSNALPTNNPRNSTDGVNFTINSGGTLSVQSGQSAAMATAGITQSHAQLRNITLNTATISLGYLGTGTALNTEAFQHNGNMTVSGGVSNIVYGNGGNTTNANIGINQTSTWTVNSGATLNVAPMLVNGNGSAGALVKAGTGTLNLNANNSYSGGTTINAGSLFVNGQTGTNSGTGTGSVTVNNTGSLRGTGRAAGAVTVNNGGTIQAGNTLAPISTLTLGNNLNLQSGGTIGVRLTSSGVRAVANSGGSSGTPNTVNNFLLIQGNATINGSARIRIDGAGATFANGTYSYLIGDATNDLSGLNISTASRFTFTNFNTSILAGSVSLRGNSNGNLYLNFTTVPEPGWMLGLGAVMLFGLINLKRRTAALCLRIS
jgi:fibronectin-binding autotransporter adhesin